MKPPDKNPPDAPAFAAPWEAQAFALATALSQAGHFTWAEWTETLGARLNRADAAPDGSDYYAHWLAALEDVLAQKGLATPDAVTETTAAWHRAAEATPHGQAIALSNDPQG
ncbi:MAG: nitrile hydratase accessory protein [Pseudomonadota bacterium]